LKLQAGHEEQRHCDCTLAPPDEAGFRALVERGTDLTVLVERDGDLRWVSSGVSRVLGRTADDLVGTATFDLIHPADRDLVATAFSLTLKSSTTGPLQYRVRDGRGRWRRVETVLTNMLDDPDVGAIVLSMRTPRDRLDVLEGGRETDDRFRRLLEQSPDGVFVVDEDFAVIYATAVAVRLLGAPSPGSILGRPFFEFVPSDDVEPLHRALGSALHVGSAEGAEEGTIVRVDGRRVDVEISAAAVTHSGRRALHLIVRDVSDRKEAEREAERTLHALEEDNRELASFGAIALHDLMQPTQVVFGYLMMLEEGKSTSPAQVREWAGRSVQTLRRMHAMLDSLAVRSQAGSSGLELAEVDLAALVSDVLADVAPTIAEVGALVEVDALPTLIVDPVQIGELIQNLVTNGLKFVREDVRPRLHISAARDDDGRGWRISITDNGEGVPADLLDEVFEPFRRGSRAGQRPGSGLGLYTCKRIVERHGGHIWLVPLEPTGTCVSFTVPDSDEAEASGQSS
jgi:PAS domain S-box-containing protein